MLCDYSLCSNKTNQNGQIKKKKKEVEWQHYKLMGVQKKNKQTDQMQEKQLTKFGFTFASD